MAPFCIPITPARGERSLRPRTVPRHYLGQQPPSAPPPAELPLSQEPPLELPLSPYTIPEDGSAVTLPNPVALKPVRRRPVARPVRRVLLELRRPEPIVLRSSSSSPKSCSLPLGSSGEQPTDHPSPRGWGGAERAHLPCSKTHRITFTGTFRPNSRRKCASTSSTDHFFFRASSRISLRSSLGGISDLLSTVGGRSASVIPK